SFDHGDSLTNLGSTGAFVGGTDSNQFIGGEPIAYGGRLNGVAYPDVIYAGSGANSDFFGSGAHIIHPLHHGDPLTTLSGHPGDAVITLVVDPQDYRRVYAFDVHSQVWASFDEGATWRELTANLRDLNPYAFGGTIEIYSTSPSTQEDVLLLGMLGGVFEMVRPDSPGAKWTLLGDGLPHTTADIHYDYTDNVLLASAFGRGAWTLSNPFGSSGAASLVAPASAGVVSEKVPGTSATARSVAATLTAAEVQPFASLASNLLDTRQPAVPARPLLGFTTPTAPRPSPTVVLPTAGTTVPVTAGAADAVFAASHAAVHDDAAWLFAPLASDSLDAL